MISQHEVFEDAKGADEIVTSTHPLVVICPRALAVGDRRQKRQASHDCFNAPPTEKYAGRLQGSVSPQTAGLA